jgi:alcohol dehydrogenase (cytochrome c)
VRPIDFRSRLRDRPNKRHRRPAIRLLLIAAAAAASLILAGCGGSGSNSAGQATTKDVGWPHVNGTLDGQRYSPLNQVNTSNVKRLNVAWSFRVKTLGSENYPVIVDRTAYVTTTYGHIYALDAVTGKQRWSYNVGKQKNLGLAAQAAVHGFPNRGVAVGDGRVYGVTPNALLLALDQEKGRLLWKKSIGNPVFLSESAAPIFYDGMVFVGSAGSESGARGFEAAYDAKTGRQIWRHYTVPHPSAPGSWVKGNHGGGGVWMNPTIDTKTGLLYIATGNAGSDFDARVRPGRNLWADSIVCLNAKTGKQVWGYQQEHFDVWDLDSGSPPVLFPTKSGLAVGEANKGGFWHQVDARTGKRLTTPVAFVYQHRVVPKPGGPPVITWPAAVGGSEWSPVAFSPQTGLVYVSGLNMPGRIQVPKKPLKYEVGADYGGHFEITGPWAKKLPRAVTGTGTFTAIDVETGKIRWQNKEPVAMIGGATTTAGGLVFVGISGKGLFRALDAKTGRVLWQQALGGRIDDAASVYSIDGKQYVLISSGGSSLIGAGTGGFEGPSPATFTAFALGPAAPSSPTARTNTLIGTDGPGFTITMNKKTVKAGRYVITIRDRSPIHNFHLTGPGVDKKTSVPAVHTTKWTVTLKKGIYRFVCDPHRTIMHGILKVT